MLDKARVKEADAMLKQSTQLLETSLRQATATRQVMGKMLLDLLELQRQHPGNLGVADTLIKLSRVQKQNAEIETQLIQLAQTNAAHVLASATVEELEALDLDNL